MLIDLPEVELLDCKQGFFFVTLRSTLSDIQNLMPVEDFVTEITFMTYFLQV